jgi:hypothetical protein
MSSQLGKLTRRSLISLLALTGMFLGGRKLMDLIEKSQLSSLPVLPTMPTPVTRGEWGARAPNHEAPNELGFSKDAKETEWYVYPGELSDVYRTVAIHHSASLLASNETMRSIQDLHMDRNGWADVGYHYAIDRNGILYEGRDIHVRGVNVAKHNTGTIGVVVMGNFEEENPLDIQLTVLQTLVNWLAQTYPLTHLAGHGEFNPESQCPGKNMIIYLDRLAYGAGLQRGTDGYVDPV